MNGNLQNEELPQRIDEQMKEAKKILQKALDEIEKRYDNIIAECATMAITSDMIVEIAGRRDIYYLNDIMQAFSIKLNEAGISSMISLKDVKEDVLNDPE